MAPKFFAISIIFGDIAIIGLLAGIVNGLIRLGGFVLGILLIVKAFQGKKYKLPFIGNKAEKYGEAK